MNEFFERFKINKQVVQAGAPYIYMVYGKTRTVNIFIVLIDLESLSVKST